MLSIPVAFTTTTWKIEIATCNCTVELCLWGTLILQVFQKQGNWTFPDFWLHEYTVFVLMMLRHTTTPQISPLSNRPIAQSKDRIMELFRRWVISLFKSIERPRSWKKKQSKNNVSPHTLHVSRIWQWFILPTREKCPTISSVRGQPYRYRFILLGV